jgi:hypothetical protein
LACLLSDVLKQARSNLQVRVVKDFLAFPPCFELHSKVGELVRLLCGLFNFARATSMFIASCWLASAGVALNCFRAVQDLALGLNTLHGIAL